jgi:hypothetical protein
VNALASVALHQIDIAPRPPEIATATEDDARPPSFPALVSAHGALAGASQDSLLMSLWLREPGETAFRFLLGGRPELPSVRQASAGPTEAIPYPPGCRGHEVTDDWLGGLREMFPSWSLCLGEPDVLWSASAARQERHRLFSQYVTQLSGPFAWLVLASPVDADGIEMELQKLENELALLRSKTTLESDRLTLARNEARFEELSRGRAHGLWQVRILVGAAEERAARRAALLLCSSNAGMGLPYVLVPGTEVDGLDRQLEEDTSRRAATSPFLASTEYLSNLAGPPSVEMPGIRLQYTNPFDVTPEPTGGDTIPLGAVLDQSSEPAQTVSVTQSTLNRHTFVTGATGSGKSQTTRWLLEQLARAEKPVPWLVLEPAKAEYARMAGRLKDMVQVTRIRPGAPDVPPACLNPLEPALGFPLQSHVDLVRALFMAAFEASEPFPQVLSVALTRCYEEAGWDLVTGEPRPAQNPRQTADEQPRDATPSYPSLGDLQRSARAVVEGIGYGREVMANVRGFVDVRIGSLCTGTPGRFFQGGHPLDIERLLLQNVVVELEGVTDDQDKAFLIGAFIIRIVEHLRVRYGDTGTDELKHVLIVEEAHRLLKKVEGGPAAAAVELFASMLAEIRAYGEGIMVVEQIPAKVSVDVIKNTALKIMHRLPANDDRDAVGGTMNLTEEQSQFVVSLPPGVAAVSADGMDHPVLAVITPGNSRESSDGVSDAAPLLGSRSPLCDAACRTTPCTLRQISDAAHVAAEPGTLLWIEGTVMSYLYGVRPPAATPATYRRLGELDYRPRRCALSHAVDRAVGARSAHLRRYFAVADFKLAVMKQLESQIAAGDPVPVEEHTRWQVGPYRFRDVETVIENRRKQKRPVEPVKRAAWRARGLSVADDDTLDQIEARLHAQTRGRDGGGILGDTSQTGLLEAVANATGGRSASSVRLAFATALLPGPSARALARDTCQRLGLEKSQDGD